jgi:hypothetical protein
MYMQYDAQPHIHIEDKPMSKHTVDNGYVL